MHGTVELGGEVGNVAYDPDLDRMAVAVAGAGELAIIDPATLSVTARIPLSDCTSAHGVALDASTATAFVACENTATVVAVDMTGRHELGSTPVGDDPDVIAYDSGLHRLYVAAESGDVTILDAQQGHLVVTGSGHLADGAHVVALDSATHRSYYPVPAGSDGHPALLERAPAP